MASVRMSQELRSNIKSKAHQLFQPSINKAQNALADDFYDRLLAFVIKDQVESHSFIQKNPINTWPEEWLITIKGIQGNLGSLAIYNATNKQFKIPQCFDDSINYNNYFNAGNISKSNLNTEYETYQDLVNKRTTERAEFTKELELVLKRCNTLKQFLNAWPQGENLVPDEVLRKYRQPAEKRVNPAEHITPEVSTSLSAVLIKKTISNRASENK